MLPFLKPKKIASVMIAKVSPDGEIKSSHEDGEETPELMGAAEALLSAISLKDAKAVAEALKAAHEICSAGYEEKEEQED